LSSYFRLIGRARDGRALIKEIVSRLSKLEQKVNSLETIDFRHFLRSNNDRIIYVGRHQTQLSSVNIDPNLQLYQLPFEPDGKKLTCWLKFIRLENDMVLDSSGFENLATMIGAPQATSSPVSGMPALLFNGEDDGLVVGNAGHINLNGIVTGFDISLNFNPLAIDLHGGKPRIIAAKTDDDPAVRDLGWVIWMEPNGTIYFKVVIAGQVFTASYTNGIMALNRYYRLVCTFDKTTNTPKIYLNGIASTDPVSDFEGTAELPSTSLDMFIAGGDLPNESKMAGFVSDYRYWREKVLVQSEVNNYQNNNYTISNIVNVARVGVATLPPADGEGEEPPVEEPPDPGVTIKSFTATSYTAASYTVE
jgi:hypothetical protein